MAVFVRLSPGGGLAAVAANRRRAVRPVTSPAAPTGAARRPAHGHTPAQLLSSRTYFVLFIFTDIYAFSFQNILTG